MQLALLRLGRRKTLAVCMAAAAVAAGLFAAAPAMAAAAAGGGSSSGGDGSSSTSLWRIYVACACIFNALSVGGWNALDLYCAEAFPTQVCRYKLNAVDPELESAWFQPSNL
jgi:hypothetical protein